MNKVLIFPIEIATRGPVKPDQVIRTKRIPTIGRDIDVVVGTD
jgi:rhamnose utilization protein RhaD (predicted bifunctional aldolase and dehydrogenase)